MKFLFGALALSVFAISGCQKDTEILSPANNDDQGAVNAEALSKTDAGNAAGQTLYGLTAPNRLIQFSSDNPGTIISQIQVTGLQRHEKLLGIDFRPANGKLYALGNTSRVYVIDLPSGVATPVGSGPFAPALEGQFFGFDFNPTVDRIRVVSNTGQNLRLHPDLGTVVDFDPNTAGIQPDGRLAFAATDVNKGFQSTVVGVAYTNPDNDPNTGTTLYDIESVRNVLAIQNPPNNGALNTVGALGVNVTKLVGFDIASSGMAYAVLSISGVGSNRLATINLTTGRVTTLGTIGNSQPVTGLAAPLQ
jgi:hypothetical protein